MQIKQIVLLIGALIDTYFYANKHLFSYLSILRLLPTLELNGCIWYRYLIDLEGTCSALQPVVSLHSGIHTLRH